MRKTGEKGSINLFILLIFCTFRHIVSVDVLLLLNRLSVIDNDIFTQLMTRFTRVLSVQHTFEVCFNNCKALKVFLRFCF